MSNLFSIHVWTLLEATSRTPLCLSLLELEVAYIVVLVVLQKPEITCTFQLDSSNTLSPQDHLTVSRVTEAGLHKQDYIMNTLAHVFFCFFVFFFLLFCLFAWTDHLLQILNEKI